MEPPWLANDPAPDAPAAHALRPSGTALWPRMARPTDHAVQDHQALDGIASGLAAGRADMPGGAALASQAARSFPLGGEELRDLIGGGREVEVLGVGVVLGIGEERHPISLCSDAGEHIV